MAQLLRFRYGENNINTGPLKEIPEICIDHFVGKDLNSSVFFLSHAHTDHTVGLETEEFLRRLEQPGVKLYAHHLTPILLGSFSRYLKGPEGIKDLIFTRKIIPLDTYSPKLIKIPRLTGNLEVTVTLLPAGHCPGSVMFLFETDSLRILHTGDFRLTLDDLKSIAPLHLPNKKPKTIDHLYVDTTFCSKSASLFPNRRKILQEAIERIRSWITLSRGNLVYISFSAKFAHEFVLLELNKAFKQKIHVTVDRLEIYRNIPDLYKIVTLDDEETQFHLCNRKECEANGGNAITLRLSSMWFTRGQPEEDREAITFNGNNLTLCYSMHSSLQEIGMTIDYLKPKIVTPLVLPKKSNLSEIREALMSVTSHRFQFADYHSSRVDFQEDMIPPLDACLEERDETDILNEDGGKSPGTGSDSEMPNPNKPDQKKSLFQRDSPPPKKLKSGDLPIWNFSLSPSPTKNSQSQSSQDSSETDYCESTQSSTTYYSTSSQEDLSDSENENESNHNNKVSTPPSPSSSPKVNKDIEAESKPEHEHVFLRPLPLPHPLASSSSCKKNLTNVLSEVEAEANSQLKMKELECKYVSNWDWDKVDNGEAHDIDEEEDDDLDLMAHSQKIM